MTSAGQALDEEMSLAPAPNPRPSGQQSSAVANGVGIPEGYTWSDQEVFEMLLQKAAELNLAGHDKEANSIALWILTQRTAGFFYRARSHFVLGRSSIEDYAAHASAALYYFELLEDDDLNYKRRRKAYLMDVACNALDAALEDEVNGGRIYPFEMDINLVHQLKEEMRRHCRNRTRLLWGRDINPIADASVNQPEHGAQATVGDEEMGEDNQDD